MIKTIASLEGAEFLKACNKARHKAADLMQKSRVMDIRKTMPILDGTETAEERKNKIADQSSKNISAMFDRLLDEYPEETYELVRALIVCDQEPDGMDLLNAALELFQSEKVIYFLSSLAKLAQTNTQS